VISFADFATEVWLFARSVLFFSSLSPPPPLLFSYIKAYVEWDPKDDL
jgi:hypothetical protein